MALLEAFQPGIQPPLLLVQQTIKQDSGRPEFLFLGIGTLSVGLTCCSLLLAPRPLLGQVEIQPLKVLAVQSIRLDQLEQRIFDRHVQHLFQFVGK